MCLILLVGRLTHQLQYRSGQLGNLAPVGSCTESGLSSRFLRAKSHMENMPGVLRKQSAQQEQQQFMQLQQAAVAQIKAGQYQDALATVNQMLKNQPGHPISEQLRQVLIDKVDLDASSSSQQDPEESESSDEDSSEDDASSVASSAASEDNSEQSDRSDNEDASSNQAEVQAVDTCDTLHMTANSSALSAQQRRQLRDQLAEQLDDLRVQQAAQSMNALDV